MIFSRIGQRLKLIGEKIENFSYEMGLVRTQPAYLTYTLAVNDIQTQTQDFLYNRNKRMNENLYDGQNASLVSTNFISTCAKVNEKVTIGTGGSIWFYASLIGPVTIGKNSAVLEHSKLEAKNDKPILIGDDVTIQPGCHIGPGVTIGNNVTIKAGAVIEEGVSIESNVIICQGAVVKEGSIVRSLELWSGNPAQKIRIVENSELSKLAEDVLLNSKQASINQKEITKDVLEVCFERQAFLDRKFWADDILEDIYNEGNTEIVYLNYSKPVNQNPERRGLIYNKGDDKGQEASLMQLEKEAKIL